MLYRLFPWDPVVDASAPGGALFNPRAQQGSGRHDNPDLYGALYTARVEVSAVAEWLAGFRGQGLVPDDFARTDGRRWALVGLDDAALRGMVDLDDPVELAARRWRPSRVAARTLSVTQGVTGTLFAEGIPGFGWWSTLEASWPNVTLFAERVSDTLAIAEGPARDRHRRSGRSRRRRGRRRHPLVTIGGHPRGGLSGSGTRRGKRPGSRAPRRR